MLDQIWQKWPHFTMGRTRGGHRKPVSGALVHLTNSSLNHRQPPPSAFYIGQLRPGLLPGLQPPCPLYQVSEQLPNEFLSVFVR